MIFDPSAPSKAVEMKSSSATLSEIFLKELILEKFSPLLHLKSDSENNCCRTLLNRSKSTDEITQQPLLTQDKARNFSWGYPFLILLSAGIGIYSGFIFLNTSESAAELIETQMKGAPGFITEAFSQLIKYCGVGINSIFGAQIMIMLVQKIYSLTYRTHSERLFTGKVNLKPWLFGLFIALGATLPLASLDISTSHNKKEEIMGYTSSIATLPGCLFGGRLILSYFFPRIFSEIKDVKLTAFSYEQKKAITHFKNALTDGLFYKSYALLSEYENKSEEAINELKKELQKLKDNESASALKPMIQCLMPSPIDDKAVAEEKKSKISRGSINFARSFGTLVVIMTSATLVANDALTAYYAGRDVISQDTWKMIFSISASTLTALSSGGICLYSTLDIINKIWKGDTNYIKRTNAKTFYPLASLLILGSLFSGGASALAGFTKMTRLVDDTNLAAVALPKIFETFGYVGAAVVSIPYCLAWAQWLIGICSEKFSDFRTRQLLTFMNNCQELSDVLRNMNTKHAADLLKNDIFKSLTFYPDENKNDSKRGTTTPSVSVELNVLGV